MEDSELEDIELPREVPACREIGREAKQQFCNHTGMLLLFIILFPLPAPLSVTQKPFHCPQSNVKTIRRVDSSIWHFGFYTCLGHGLL